MPKPKAVTAQEINDATTALVNASGELPGLAQRISQSYLDPAGLGDVEHLEAKLTAAIRDSAELLVTLQAYKGLRRHLEKRNAPGD